MSINFTTLAVEKIANELKDFKGGNKETAVSKFVAKTLTKFCEENERFAEVVYRTPRSLSDCCAEVMDGCGNSISDIEVYKKAVQHYFPNADIHMTMEIAFTGEPPSDEEIERAPKKKPQKQKTKKSAADNADKAEDEATDAEVPTTPTQASIPKPKPQKAKSELESLQLTLF